MNYFGQKTTFPDNACKHSAHFKFNLISQVLHSISVLNSTRDLHFSQFFRTKFVVFSSGYSFERPIVLRIVAAKFILPS